ncbi:hypothetical protein AB1Y20_004717 [Prymnesium parvum]|uniref:G domain-containing protein n=1 Tax=Prymnesium parvum TaxID=97485 RepID=A0AB34IXL6_PRYPA
MTSTEKKSEVGAEAEFVEAASDDQVSAEGLAFLKQKIQQVTTVSGVMEFIKGQAKTAGLRLVPNKLYTTLEDFQRADPEKRRIVLIGCTGSGKSTIGNVAAGWKYVGKMDADGGFDFSWQHPEGAPPMFEARASGSSVTSHLSFANIDWLGDKSRPVILIDTPGHDDTAAAEIDSAEAREKLGEMAAELHDKLKAIGTIHALVVVHNDVTSNRLNPATQTILKMIAEKFAKADTSVWKNVVIAYSKCNEHDTSWRAGIAKKKTELQERIKEVIPSCDVTVPVLSIGGGELDPPAPSAQSATKGFEDLWEFVQTAPPLDTSKLQPFEGSDVKWQKLIDSKNDAEARASAAMAHIRVVAILVAMNVFLLWRALILPNFPMGTICSMCLLNIPGTALDELLLIAFVIHRMGPSHTWYSVSHFGQTMILPVVRPSLEKFLTEAETKLRDVGATTLAGYAGKGLKGIKDSKPKAD